MAQYELPFGESRIKFDLPSRWEVLKYAAPRSAPKVSDDEKEIKEAIQKPIGSKRLPEMVSPDKKIAIVVDDVSRPTPAHRIMPKLLDELLEGGAKTKNIFVIFGCATHRKLTSQDLEVRLGKDVASRIRAINSDLENNLVELGRTSYGTPIIVDKEYYRADLKIAVGTIEPHVFAGFGGGDKAVFPGIMGIQSITANHKLVTMPNSRVGVPPEENPVRKDIEEGGKVCGLDFTVHTILNDRKEIVKVVAGHPISAHREGVKVATEIYGVGVPSEADVVITSAFPLDIDIRQSGKSVVNALDAAKKGGAILCVSPCPEGAGTVTLPKPIMKPDDFVKLVRGLKETEVTKLMNTYKIPIEEWCNSYLWLSVLRRCNTFLSSTGITDQQAACMYIRNYPKISEAIAKVKEMAGEKADVLIFPVGGITFPILPR